MAQTPQTNNFFANLNNQTSTSSNWFQGQQPAQTGQSFFGSWGGTNNASSGMFPNQADQNKPFPGNVSNQNNGTSTNTLLGVPGQGNQPATNTGSTGLFGVSNQGNQPATNTGSTGLFGVSNQGNQPATNTGSTGLFGAPGQGNQQATNTNSTGLFGAPGQGNQQATNTNSTGLFGVSNQGNQQATNTNSTGLFGVSNQGNQQATNTNSTGLFGGTNPTNAPATGTNSTGWFGASNPTNPTNPTNPPTTNTNTNSTGLFGASNPTNPPATTTSAGLFGTSNQTNPPVTTSNSLFAADSKTGPTTNSNPNQLFSGGPNSNQTTTPNVLLTKAPNNPTSTNSDLIAKQPTTAQTNTAPQEPQNPLFNKEPNKTASQILPGFNANKQDQSGNQSTLNNPNLTKSDKISSIYNSILGNAENAFAKDTILDDLGIYSKHFDLFLPRSSYINTTRIDHLYVLFKNWRNNLEKNAPFVSDSTFNSFWNKHNINLTAMDNDMNALEAKIHSKYDHPENEKKIILEDKLNNLNHLVNANIINRQLIRSSKASKGRIRGSNISARADIFINQDNNINVIKAKSKSNHNNSTNAIINNFRDLTIINQNGSQSNMCNSNYTANNSQIANTKTSNLLNWYNLPTASGNKENEIYHIYYNSFVPYFEAKAMEKGGSVSNRNLLINSVQNLMRFTKPRNNLYDLLYNQLSESKELTSENLLNATIRYYEKTFSQTLLQNNNGNINTASYKAHLQVIEDYTNRIIYSKFSKEIEKYDRDDIILWAKIFFFFRAGFTKQLQTFLTGLTYKNTDLNNILLFITSSNPIEKDLYQIIFENSTKSERAANPFKHACFWYILKKMEPWNEVIFEDINDYIWFYWSMISCDDIKFKKLVPDMVKTPTISAFQAHMLQIDDISESLPNSSNIVIDYTIIWISLGWYENALKFLSEQKSYEIDCACLYFILYQCGLLTNTTEINSNIIDPGTSSVNVRNNPAFQNYLSYFKTSARFNHVYETILYLKYSDANYIKSIADIIIQTEQFSIFDYVYHSPHYMNKTKQQQIINEHTLLSTRDILSKEEIREIIQEISNMYTSKPINNYTEFVTLLRQCSKFGLYQELLQWLWFNIQTILTNKTPSHIYNERVHGIKTNDYHDYQYNMNIINRTYKEIFDDINCVLMSDHIRIEEKAQLSENFKYVRQLECWEEIYNLMYINRYEHAFEWFNKIITMSNPDDVDKFLNTDFLVMIDGVKQLYPDVLYAFSRWLEAWFIAKKQQGNAANKMKNVCKELMMNLNTWMEFVGSWYEKTKNEKLKYIYNDIQEFVSRY